MAMKGLTYVIIKFCKCLGLSKFRCCVPIITVIIILVNNKSFLFTLVIAIFGLLIIVLSFFQKSTTDFEKLSLEMSELEKQEQEFRRKEEELKREERVC